MTSDSQDRRLNTGDVSGESTETSLQLKVQLLHDKLRTLPTDLSLPLSVANEIRKVVQEYMQLPTASNMSPSLALLVDSTKIAETGTLSILLPMFVTLVKKRSSVTPQVRDALVALLRSKTRTSESISIICKAIQNIVEGADNSVRDPFGTVEVRDSLFSAAQMVNSSDAVTKMCSAFNFLLLGRRDDEVTTVFCVPELARVLMDLSRNTDKDNGATLMWTLAVATAVGANTRNHDVKAAFATNDFQSTVASIVEPHYRSSSLHRVGASLSIRFTAAHPDTRHRFHTAFTRDFLLKLISSSDVPLHEAEIRAHCQAISEIIGGCKDPSVPCVFACPAVTSALLNICSSCKEAATVAEVSRVIGGLLHYPVRQNAECFFATVEMRDALCALVDRATTNDAISALASAMCFFVFGSEKRVDQFLSRQSLSAVLALAQKATSDDAAQNILALISYVTEYSTRARSVSFITDDMRVAVASIAKCINTPAGAGALSMAVQRIAIGPSPELTVALLSCSHLVKPGDEYFFQDAVGIVTNTKKSCAGRSLTRQDLESVKFTSMLRVPPSYVPTSTCKESMLDAAFLLSLPAASNLDVVVSECESKLTSLQLLGLQHSLTRDEAIAVLAYTFDLRLVNKSSDPTGEGCDNFYVVLNTTLRKRTELASTTLAALLPYLHYLNSGLRKLPLVSNSFVYRGIPCQYKNMIDGAYVGGTKVYWSGFTSTTTNIAKAKWFAKGLGGILFRVKIHDGRSIASYSHFPEEAEVVLSPNAAFVVVKPLHISTADLTNGYYIVDLAQILGDDTEF